MSQMATEVQLTLNVNTTSEQTEVIRAPTSNNPVPKRLCHLPEESQTLIPQSGTKMIQYIMSSASIGIIPNESLPNNYFMWSISNKESAVAGENKKRKACRCDIQ